MNEEERIIRSIKYIINQNYVDTEDDIIGILIKALNLIEKQDKIINEMADRKDGAEADLYEANHRINDLLDLDTQKDKLIDWLVEEIHSIVNLGEFIDNNINKLETKGEIKKYFEERCK